MQQQKVVIINRMVINGSVEFASRMVILARIARIKAEQSRVTAGPRKVPVGLVKGADTLMITPKVAKAMGRETVMTVTVVTVNLRMKS